MTLNMRNYKGFNKDPYCEAHIPKAKATTVAETPELKRIAENTKLQSNVKYHAEFEKTKGKLTQVADDPETLRIKQNSKIISNVAYHGELQKKAAMEQKRNINGENGDTSAEVDNQLQSPNNEYNNPPPPPQQQAPPPPQGNQMMKEFTNVQSANTVINSPYSARQSSTLIFSSERGAVNSPAGRHIGSIADFDPVNNYYGSLTSSQSSGQSRQQQQRTSGRVYKAMYDYEAQDRDEVSFIDGDLIVDCSVVEAGWMTGLVQRTGQVGMLPANYVEQVN